MKSSHMKIKLIIHQTCFTWKDISQLKLESIQKYTQLIFTNFQTLRLNLMQDEKEIRSFYRIKDMFVQEFVPANTESEYPTQQTVFVKHFFQRFTKYLHYYKHNSFNLEPKYTHIFQCPWTLCAPRRLSSQFSESENCTHLGTDHIRQITEHISVQMGLLLI